MNIEQSEITANVVDTADPYIVKVTLDDLSIILGAVHDSELAELPEVKAALVRLGAQLDVQFND
jgi:hypothetical protein